MQKKLFGTDGIRCKAGEFPLTPETISKIAYAAGLVLTENANSKNVKKVAIGIDTRESGVWITKSLAKGFNKLGIQVDFSGIIPTPALSVFTRNNAYSFGIMISASHNPFYDNGIKFFSETGEKLSDDIELKIEQKYYELADLNLESADSFYNDVSQDIYKIYKNVLLDSLDEIRKFTEFRIALDPANGSLFDFAPKIFSELGTRIEFADNSNTPTGKNINENCGSTHIQNLLNFMKKNSMSFDIGFSFDGDGDRLIAIRKDGKILDGDVIMGLFAKIFKSQNELTNNCLVLTVMSNLGLKLFLARENIDFCETKVGDRYVYEALTQQNAVIGGEQSGHIILKKFHKTGDGLLAALQIMKILKEIGEKEFNKITDEIKIFPQILVNVRLREKTDIFSVTEIKNFYEKIVTKLGESGRILVRYSGTEPLLRIMLEGENQDEIQKLANDFAELVKQKLV